MRLPSLLLSVLVPVGVLVAPVSTPPGPPPPRPVEPSVVELPLEPARELPAATGPRTVVLTEEQDTAPFSTVGVTWAPGSATGEVVVQVRTRGEQGWTGWQPVETEQASEVVAATPEAASPDLRDGAGPAWAGDSDGVQVRIDVLDGTTPSEVELVLVDPGTSPADVPAAVPASVAGAADLQQGRPAIREPWLSPQWFGEVVWRPATARAGLDWLHFHDLRHAHATWLLAAGVPVRSVQKRLGHKNLATTEIYLGELVDVEDVASFLGTYHEIFAAALRGELWDAEAEAERAVLSTAAGAVATPDTDMLGELLNALPPERLAALLTQALTQARPAISD